MEQKHVSPEKKDSILKSLAIAGFIAIIVILAWLSIQLVQLVPNAVTSLASLADGVSQYQESLLDLEQDVVPLVVTSDTTLINNGGDVTINWSDLEVDGSYIFSYDCIDGVSLAEQSQQGERILNCNTNYNLGTSNSITLTVESEKNRYADVAYNLAFLRTGDSTPRATGNNVVTVANQDIESQFAFAPDDSELTNDEVVEPVPEPEPETPVEPIPVTPEPPVEVVEEFIYEVPVSDPDGTVDLSVLYVGVGEVVNGRFIPGPVSVQNDGAIQFSVRNVGTKTSEAWTFSVDMPNGSTFNSQGQDGLKPNERAVLTIGFAAGGDTPHAFVVDVDTNDDNRSSNDGFSRTVTLAE